MQDQEQVEEMEYIMVESGQAPLASNNLLPLPVLLTTGEADYVNKELKEFNSTQIYIPLEKKDKSNG